MQQTPSARLVLPPFQIDSNVLQKKKMKNIAETRFNESVLAGETTGKCLYKDVFIFKTHWGKVWLYPKTSRKLAQCSVPNTPLHKMFNILFKNLQIGIKIHIWIAKWFLTIQMRTIPYYWKSWFQYLPCPRISPDNPRILQNRVRPQLQSPWLQPKSRQNIALFLTDAIKLGQNWYFFLYQAISSGGVSGMFSS